MRVQEIIDILERLAPPKLAMSWDNVGLLAGRRDREVTGVYVGLDATEAVIRGAIDSGCNMLLTHHPLLFAPVKQINDDDFIGNRLLLLLEHGISYYAMHTSYDSAPGCMADLAAQMLGIEDGQPLEPVSAEGEPPCGIGKAGRLAEPVTLKQLCDRVKTQFHLPAVQVFPAAREGRKDQDSAGMEQISRIAVSPGSGKSMISHALACDAQVLITGDIGHHEGIDAAACGLTVIDAGHYGLEHIFISHMTAYLQERLGGDIPVKAADFRMPFCFL